MEERSTPNDNPPSSSGLDESYSKYGITDMPKISIATSWGQTKTFAGLSRKDWTFLLVTTVNILTAIGLTLYRFIKVIKDDSEKADFTFALLLLINSVFCMFYAFHGVLRERVYELYVLIIAIIVIVAYCVLEYAFFNVAGRTTLKLVRMILALVLAPPNIYLSWAVARDFGYIQFRTVGASEHLQYLYEQASIFSCALKFDVQVTMSIVVLVLRNGTKVTLADQVILGIGIPYSLLWNVLGWFVLRKEWKHAAVVFAVLGLAKPAYYISKIVLEYIDIGNNVKESDTITYSILTAGALALLVWLLLMMELVVVYRNFDKGLKERAFDVKPTEKTSLITGKRVHPA